LENRHGNDPWFLKVSFTHPHTPLNPPQRWYDRYASVSIPSPDVSRWATERFGSMRTSFAQNPGASRGVIPEEEIRATRRSYAAAISFVDEQIGRIIAALEKRGELDRTLILFTSDHGDMMGDHLLYRKTYPYEGSVRVPMIVRWPASLGLKARRGQVREELSELRDVLPTFLDAAGLSIPPPVEGLSLLKVLRGKPGHAMLDLEHSSCYEPKDGWVGLLGPRYKYVYFEHTGKQQLFDLTNDAKELNDLALDPGSARLVQEWRSKMIQHLAARGEPWVVAGDLAIQDKSIGSRKNNPNVAR
jgi:arylsulfatase A-like enzyme